MTNFDDKPISQPADDLFGFDPFAKAIAQSILALDKPEGSVISINGPWGTGKSSVVNLVKHHLATSKAESNLKVIDFKCWWFRGEEALALEFFRELYSAMDIANGDKAKEAISELGSRVLTGSSSFVGAALNMVVPAVGTAAGSGMNLIGDLIKQDKTVEGFHQKIADTLRSQNQKFLIVIDDIDRLSPDEALLIFRLVKSIGQLPNVMYLLAYDREIAERVVSERYPSEGPQYLEKIVQAGFDLPAPPKTKLTQGLLEFLNELWKDQKQPDQTRFWNLFHDVVAPHINTPRDLHRIINTVKISWRAVDGEVDPVDFLCIETLRVQVPQVYNAIRSNKHRLVNEGESTNYQNRSTISQAYDEIFVGALEGEAKDQMKIALRRLFPALENIWANMSYGSNFFSEWDRGRRVCSKKHFETYFRFALADGNISAREVNALLARCDDQKFVEDALRQAVTIPNNAGGTRAASLLDELNLRSPEIPLDSLPAFLSAVFAAHDEINVVADAGSGFSYANNNLRVHWLLRKSLKGRADLAERSRITLLAAQHASVGWLADLSSSAHNDYNPREGEAPSSEDDCLTTEADASKLKKLTLDRIKEVTDDGSLMNYPYLNTVLWRWGDFAGDDGFEAAKAWCNSKLDVDENVCRFANAFMSSSWSQGLGGMGGGLVDTVSTPSDNVSIEAIEKFFDIGLLKQRLLEVIKQDALTEQSIDILKRFSVAWNLAKTER